MKNGLVFFVICALTTVSTHSMAQTPSSSQTTAPPALYQVTPRKLNAISLEVLGRSGFYSVNYDRRVYGPLHAGVGYSQYYYDFKINGLNTNTGDSLPIASTYLNYYLGKGKSRAFLTGGANFAIRKKDPNRETTTLIGGKERVWATAGGGYEYRANDGLLLRAAPYLIVARKATLWLGGSVGLAF